MTVPRNVREVAPGAGAVIRAARRAAGLTQPHVAAKVGVGTSYISEIEMGKHAGVSFILMVKIALVLRVPVGDLAAAAIDADPSLQALRLGLDDG